MKEQGAFPGSKIVVLDFGSQYTQVIARRIRECSVFSVVLPYRTRASELARMAPDGIILSGGPASVCARGAPHPDPAVFDLGVPILGICYGLQIIGDRLGGRVEPSALREYGAGRLEIDAAAPLFHGLASPLDVWNSHGDRITRLPRGFRVIGRTAGAPCAAIEHRRRRIYGLQFHPEVSHTPRGREILQNFVYRICGCSMDWTLGEFVEQTCARIRERVGRDRVILGLSGGVDSSVAAALLHRAIGDRLTCIFVDNGLLRAREAEIVRRVFGQHFRVRLRVVNASRRFLRALRGVRSPERKRKIIGREFIAVFEDAAAQLMRARPGQGAYRFLAQGTLYPDVIESVPISGNPASMIKSHHNVGGLPRRMRLELIEPLRHLFKDEVRQVGSQLGLPREIVHRQPFPGPGLAVRVAGEVTPARLRMVREADAIVVAEMKAADWYYRVWQSFAVLLPVRSVGVMGDERTYEHTVTLRVVESQDGMTADWVRLPYDLLARIAGRVINEVRGVNRVLFDVSTKPPSTIEWE